MPNEQDQIIFITPENLKIVIPTEDLYEVCKQYCISYIDKSDANRETFERFASQYSYFDPYYDFLICVLKWISLPSLLDRKSYVQRGSNEGMKVLRELIESDQLDYDKLYLEGSYIREVYNSTDKNIGLNATNLIAHDGFIDENGMHLSTKGTCSHELTASAILYGICYENHKIISDVYTQCKERTMGCGPGISELSEYIEQRLGFPQIGTHRGWDTISYCSSLLTPKQKKAIAWYEEMGILPFPNSNCNFNVMESKALTAYYRSCRIRGRCKI